MTWKTNKAKVSALFLTATLLSSLWLASSLASPAGGFYFSNAPSSVRVGTVFTVDVRLNSGVTAVNSFHIDVNYPTDLLDAVAGSEISPAVSPFNISSYQHVQAGTITTERLVFSGSTTSTSGDNYIATLTFKAKAAGNVNLSFSNSTAGAYGGSDVISTRNNLTLPLTTPPPPVPPPVDAGNITAPPATSNPPVSTPPNPPPVTKTNTNTSKAPSTATSKQTSTELTPQKPASTTPTATTINSDSQPAASENQQSSSTTLVLLDNEHHPLKNAEVSLNDGSTAKTNDKGKVTFEGLEPGKHPINITYKGELYSSNFSVQDAGNTTEPQSQNISVTLRSSHSPAKTAALSATLLTVLVIAVFIFRFVFLKPHYALATTDVDLVNKDLSVGAIPINSISTPPSPAPESVVVPVFSTPGVPIAEPPSETTAINSEVAQAPQETEVPKLPESGNIKPESEEPDKIVYPTKQWHED